MTSFVAVVGTGRGIPDLPAACVAAARLTPTVVPVLHASDGCSAAAFGGPDHRVPLLAAGARLICGDVRLDGAAQLAKALQLPDGAHRAPGRPDPWVGRHVALVAAAHDAWDAEAPARLRGDFSYLAWDPVRRHALAARDGLGVRPLFFARTAGAVVLSNVLNAVRAHPGVSSRLNPEAVASFLQVGWNQDLESTTFADIRRVPPGHLLRIVDGEVTVTRHWSLPDPPPIELADDAEYTERYRALLETAVAERLAPDRTVLFLSGGIDSPTIAAAAVSGGHGAELATVTIRNREVETETESRLAAAVAERLRLRHRLLEYALAPTPEDPPATPEPYDDPEYRATTAFYREVSAGASVVIEGEDGDALFSPPSFLHQARQHGAFAVLRRFAAYTIGHGRRPYLGFWLRRRIAGVRRPLRPHVAPWLVGAAAAIPDRPTSAVSHRARPEAATSLTSSIWQCVHDGCSQAYHGTPFEFRWPLLDTRLIEFVFSIPPVPWCQRKWLARRAYAARLPAQVLTRDKTTVPGYYERLVAAWRARTGGRVDLRAPATAEFVDAGRLTTALAATDTETVMAAWRAIEFDRWVHAAGLR